MHQTHAFCGSDECRHPTTTLVAAGTSTSICRAPADSIAPVRVKYGVYGHCSAPDGAFLTCVASWMLLSFGQNQQKDYIW
jgi:hypothetical protein